jgi:hypothetical protein
MRPEISALITDAFKVTILDDGCPQRTVIGSYKIIVTLFFFGRKNYFI